MGKIITVILVVLTVGSIWMFVGQNTLWFPKDISEHGVKIDAQFMRTLWVCAAAGGPYTYNPTKAGKTELGLEEAHRQFRISPDEFDEVAAELGRSLDFAKVPEPEKAEVLAAFAAHKNEVTAGYVATIEPGPVAMPA